MLKLTKLLIIGQIMKFIKIEPAKKSITILDNDIEVAELVKKSSEDAIEVEKGLNIISFPDEEQKNFFYYVTQDGMEGEIFTFKGIGIAFGDRIEERIEEIKKKIVW